MTVAMVLNGVPELQISMADGLLRLKVLLDDRLNAGCTVTPTEEPAYGVEYRIQNPGAGVEVAYLTDYPDPANPDWDPG